MKTITMAILYIPMLMVYKAESFLNTFIFILGYKIEDEKIVHDVSFDFYNIIIHSIRWFVLLYFISVHGAFGVFVYISLAIALDMFFLVTEKIADILIDKFG